MRYKKRYRKTETWGQAFLVKGKVDFTFPGPRGYMSRRKVKPLRRLIDESVRASQIRANAEAHLDSASKASAELNRRAAQINRMLERLDGAAPNYSALLPAKVLEPFWSHPGTDGYNPVPPHMINIPTDNRMVDFVSAPSTPMYLERAYHKTLWWLEVSAHFEETEKHAGAHLVMKYRDDHVSCYYADARNLLMLLDNYEDADRYILGEFKSYLMGKRS